FVRLSRVVVIALCLFWGVSVAAGAEEAAGLPSEVREAFARLPDYRDGGDRSALVTIRRAVQRGTPEVRRGLASLLAGVLRSREATAEGRRFACLMLLRIAGPDSLPLLGELLRDEQVGDLALAGIVSLAYPEAEAILLDALRQATGDRRVALVRAVGERRVTASVPVLVECLGSGDAPLREAAVGALGRIGGEASLGALAGMLTRAEDPGAAGLAAKAFTTVAGSAEAGRVRRILLRVQAEGTPPGRCAALRLLAETPDPEILRTLLDALGDPVAEVRRGAAEALGEWPDTAPAAPLLDACRGSDDEGFRQHAIASCMRMAAAAGGPETPTVRDLVAAASGVARTDAEKALVQAVFKSLRVLEATLSTGKSCEVVDAGLKPGAPVYMDRPYTFVKVPEEILGATYVKMVMEDRNVAGDGYFRCRVSKPVTGYVAFDGRATDLPAWLRDWERTDLRLESTDAACRPGLFRRAFPAGEVSLGGNRAPGAGSQYTVILQPR
ncbi:MAG: HEAT repeat domain-containing protein, partial [Lentisphaeria bacterium]|nr:HEAT repeat domain-containing protein [Lentisphaeria bacterium]